MQDLRAARMSLGEALRRFRWLEYRPFLWIMLLEILFLVAASNLHTSWGMAAAGGLMKLATGQPGVHYPTSFVVLAEAYSLFDSFLIAIAGSFLIPLALIRIQARTAGVPATGPAARGRAASAYLPTFLSFVLNFAVLWAWQELVPRGPSRWIRLLFPGTLGETAVWILSVLFSCLIAALVIYVPVRAVFPGTSIRDALLGGIGEGWRTLGPTFAIILVLTIPALIVLAPVQMAPIVIANKLRPELLAVLLGVATVLASFVNYFIYSAVARFHGSSLR